MVPTVYLITVIIATAFGWGSWAVVLTKLSPFSVSPLPLILFYASLFVALSGTLTLLNHFLRLWLGSPEAHGKAIHSSVRQATLLSLMVCIGIGFQRLRVLTWWDALLLLAIVLLIEFYFMATE